MSEPIEQLNRFTPAAAGLDRDRLLFEAGRASARPNRRWRALCAALTASQILTLALFAWPHTVVPPERPAPRVVKQAPPTVAPPALWQMRDQAIRNDGDLPPAPATDQLVAAQAPLHAFGVLPKSLIE